MKHKERKKMSKECITIIAKEDPPKTVKEHDHPICKGTCGEIILHGQLPIENFRKNLLEFTSQIESVLNQINTKFQQYSLDEIEMCVEVSLSGGISLIGSVEAETKGGMILRFKRNTK